MPCHAIVYYITPLSTIQCCWAPNNVIFSTQWQSPEVVSNKSLYGGRESLPLQGNLGQLTAQTGTFDLWMAGQSDWTERGRQTKLSHWSLKDSRHHLHNANFTVAPQPCTVVKAMSSAFAVLCINLLSISAWKILKFAIIMFFPYNAFSDIHVLRLLPNISENIKF